MMDSSAPVAPLAPDVLDPRRWWALALLCGAFFMVILDGTITIVALPSIGADLRFSEQGLQCGRGERTSHWIQSQRSAPGTEKTRPNAADQRHWQLTHSNERRSENGKDRRERKRHARWSRPGSGR
jgi:hypothetical protein